MSRRTGPEDVVTQNRRQWPAMTYPELPARMSPEATAKRAYLRIGLKVARIVLPIMLAAGFAALAGHSSGPHYAGDRTAQAVMVLTKTTEIVTCEDVSKTAGAVSECAAKPSSGPGLETFEVTFVDDQGNFTLSWPDDRIVMGTIQK